MPLLYTPIRFVRNDRTVGPHNPDSSEPSPAVICRARPLLRIAINRAYLISWEISVQDSGMVEHMGKLEVCLWSFSKANRFD
jgi:hypothetical protein